MTNTFFVYISYISKSLNIKPTKKMKIKTLLISFLLLGSFTAATAQDSASMVLDKVSAQAKKENKKVFVMFHASWCGWCKKMEKHMQDPAIKKYFDDNYITAFLTVQESPKNKSLENPGAAELLAKYKAQNSGICTSSARST